MAKTKKRTEKLPLNAVTQSVYSRHRGVSPAAVKKAIDSCRLERSIYRMKSGKIMIIQDIADDEWQENTDFDHHSTKVTEKKEEPPEQEPVQKQKKQSTQVKSKQPEPSTDASLAAAKKALAVYKAKMAQLSYEQAKGLLVDKQQVYEQLFSMGKDVRTDFMNMPDRIIDDILSGNTRLESFNVLYDEIVRILNKLADNIGNFQKK